jgi:hypothetical protein
MEDINKYLNADANEEERAAAALLQEGFSALRLERKVEAAAAARARAKRQQRNNRFGAVLLLLSLSIAFWLWFSKQETTTSAPFTEEKPVEQEKKLPTSPAPAEEEEPASVLEKEAPPVETPERTIPTRPPGNVPIAQAEPSLPPPSYGAPATYLRGGTQEAAGKKLLDQLWYTGYPLTGLRPAEQYMAVDELLRKRTFTTAYVRLQRLDRQLVPNDTLRYLQAYTLLEMGQGQEALALLDQLEQPPAEWLPQVEWYRGLAALLVDDKTTAMAIFQKIAKQKNHPYQLQARKALKVYQ